MAYSRRREVEEPQDEPSLTRTDAMVVQVARHALGQAVAQHAPAGSNQLGLVMVAVAGMFCDILSHSRAASDIIAVVNAQLGTVGLEVVSTRRN